jgi:predicted nuclease with TOPRIM domain
MKPIETGAMVFALIAVLLVGGAGAQTLELVLNEQVAANKKAAAAQAHIDQLADQTQGLLSKYSQTLATNESLKKYNDQLQLQVNSQKDRIADVQRELGEINTTQQSVLPLMQRMIDTLDKFVQLDTPFLLEERTKRVAGLKQMMERADVSSSEKYRRILEAYQIETEYGRTIEAYDGKLGDGDQAKTVEFLRVGRLALLYQTPDGKETGYWDADQKKWVTSDEYASNTRQAIRIAKKEGAPDLLWIPVHAPVPQAPQSEVQ